MVKPMGRQEIDVHILNFLKCMIYFEGLLIITVQVVSSLPMDRLHPNVLNQRPERNSSVWVFNLKYDHCAVVGLLRRSSVETGEQGDDLAF